MFVLHSLFEMNEYFIRMNNKYAFFLLGNVSTLLFTTAEAFTVFIAISHSLTQLAADCCSLFLYRKLFGA